MEEVRPVVEGLVPRVYPLEYPPVVPWVVRPEIRPAAFLIMLPKFTMNSFGYASIQAATSSRTGLSRLYARPRGVATAEY